MYDEIVVHLDLTFAPRAATLDPDIGRPGADPKSHQPEPPGAMTDAAGLPPPTPISREHSRCINLAHAEARGRVEKPASAFDRALTSAKSKVICASPRLRSGVGSRPSRVPKAKSSRANGSSPKLICVVSVR